MPSQDQGKQIKYRPKMEVPLSAYHIHTAWNLHNIAGIKYVHSLKLTYEQNISTTQTEIWFD